MDSILARRLLQREEYAVLQEQNSLLITAYVALEVFYMNSNLWSPAKVCWMV